MIDDLKLGATLRGWHVPSLGQKARTLVDVAVLASVLIYMAWLGSPTWALALVFYVASRTSRLDSASDAGAVQSSVADLRDSVELLRLDFSAAIAKADKEREELKRAKRPAHIPPTGIPGRVHPGGRA